MSGLWAEQAPGVDGRLYEDGEDDELFAVEIPVEVQATICVRVLARTRDAAERRAREVYPRLRFVSARLDKSGMLPDIDTENVEMVLGNIR